MKTIATNDGQQNSPVFNPMDWSALVHEYGLDGKRLLPWEGLNSPFGGAYCVVRSNTESVKHDHNEHELFICINGRANVVMGSDSHEMKAGDMIRIPLNTPHYIDNCFEEDFHFFTLWWDKDTAREYIETDKELV